MKQNILVVSYDYDYSKQIASKLAGLFSMHLFDELENIVDNVVMVKHGNVVLEGELEDIRAQYGKSISDLYREIYGSNDGLSDEIWGK